MRRKLALPFVAGAERERRAGAKVNLADSSLTFLNGPVRLIAGGGPSRNQIMHEFDGGSVWAWAGKGSSGLLVSRIPEEWSLVFKSPLPLKRLGFSKVAQLLTAMPQLKVVTAGSSCTVYLASDAVAGSGTQASAGSCADQAASGGLVGGETSRHVREWLRARVEKAGPSGLVASRIPAMWAEDYPNAGPFPLKQMGVSKLIKFLYACSDIVRTTRPTLGDGTASVTELLVFPIDDASGGTTSPPLKVDAGKFGVQCVTFNGAVYTIVAGCGNGNIFFIDTTTSQVRESPLKVDAGFDGVHCVTFNSTGDTIVAGCDNGNIFFIDTATSQVREPPLSCGSPVYTIALKDNMLVAGCQDGKIKLFKLNASQDWGEIQSEPPLKVDAGAYGVECVTFNGTGDTIVAGCGNGNIFFIDTSTGQVREPPLRGHRYVPSLSREYFHSCF